MSTFASVLITGANRGLGLEFVQQFLRVEKPPEHIFATCRNPEDAQELKAFVKDNPTRLHVLELDITNTSQYDRVVDEVSDIVGARGLNLLINNAGYFNKEITTIEHQTKDELMRHFEVNTVSPTLVTKAFLPLLKKAAAASPELGAKKSSVVFVASLLGCFGPKIPKNSPYRYSKAALHMVMHCLAMEFEPQGVLVTGIHPGHVKTDMGGEDAPITKEDSVGGCMSIILAMDDSHRGKLFKFDGGFLDW